MHDQNKAVLAADLKRLSEEISLQPWAKSRKRKDIARRDAALAMVHALSDALKHGDLTPAMIDRQRRRLLAEYPAPIQSGLSVGFIRGRKLKWIDVPGENNPVTASARARDYASKHLMPHGYREYGITPTFTYPSRPW